MPFIRIEVEQSTVNAVKARAASEGLSIKDFVLAKIMADAGVMYESHKSLIREQRGAKPYAKAYKKALATQVKIEKYRQKLRRSGTAVNIAGEPYGT